MEKENGTIYIATNLLNGKQYVGQTVRTLKARIISHKNQNGILTKAIKRYGIENFKWISFSCNEENLDWVESLLIKELHTQAPNGYNLDDGGHKNKHHHESTIQKIRKNHKDNSGEKNGMFGRTGNKHPNFGKIGEKNPLYGRKRPEIAEKQKGENNPWFGKGYLQIGEKNPMYGKSPYDVWLEKYGKEVADEKLHLLNEKRSKLFCREKANLSSIILISPGGVSFSIPNLKLFCKEHGLGITHIYEVLRGEKKQHKGWTGKYLNNEVNKCEK